MFPSIRATGPYVRRWYLLNPDDRANCVAASGDALSPAGYHTPTKYQQGTTHRPSGCIHTPLANGDFLCPSEILGGMITNYDYDYDYIMAPQRGRPYGANLGSMGRNTGTWSIRSECLSNITNYQMAPSKRGAGGGSATHKEPT